MTKIQVWRRLPGTALLVLLNVFTAVALIFEGYNQGVLGTVSGTPGFIDMADIGSNGVVTDTTKQGGLAAAYYFGAMWGCFLGGWVGDKFGRKKGVFVGAVLCMLGGALMSGSVNANMFICARVIAGLGIGFINSIIPSWVSELSQAHNRGSSFSLIFIANFGGIVLAYWINYGIRNSEIVFRWRFPLGFMVVPMFIVAIMVPTIPEWLIANGRRDEAIEILSKIRGDLALNDPKLTAEIEQLDAVVEASYHRRNNYINLVLGGRYSGKLHLGRRVVMGFALQQIQQWTGILAIATWAGKLFDLAGFAPEKSAWLAGLLNTFGIFGTAAAALVIDRYGRRASLLISFAIQGISLFLVAALIKTSEDNQASDPTKASELGTAAASFLFVFLWFFTMFNIVPCWIYGTEIWPQEVRAKGYSFTILGWAIGCGMTTFVIPILLQHLGWATFVFFGALNVVASPIIYFFYPETANRSLEEMNLIFTSGSWLVSENMKEYHRRVEAAGGNIAVAARALLDEVDGETHLDPRRIIAGSEEGVKGDTSISSIHDEIREKV
ncbi:hypothetical protein IFR05_011860 [Cadophora sp. M221]|nr:hypothetical protein IFR05_011860 [Cadophora sp. M221]